MYAASPPCSPACAATGSGTGLDKACIDTLPSLHSFANGGDRDLDAVIAGLTLPYSSGLVEGHVNRARMIKRQMLGRAGFHLLRQRVLS
ncbi:transposase [Arthrobacter cavernae]|uniref:Transposase n=1 Tax=Arthrobacter cavernae TaxID=2817681 RepID=A0A939HFB9_9MICC|nr:transposase [Arthrobacter cavernae]